MTDFHSPTQQPMTPDAAEAFASYVAMGPGRSLRALASILVEQKSYKTTATAASILSRWSSKYRWQERLAAAITAQTEERLAKAAEIDAASFLRTSELLAGRLSYTDPLHVDTVIKVRESVRKPQPKGGAVDVNLNLSATLRLIVERVAAERGLNPDEVLAQADAILAETR